MSSAQCASEVIHVGIVNAFAHPLGRLLHDARYFRPDAPVLDPARPVGCRAQDEQVARGALPGVVLHLGDARDSLAAPDRGDLLWLLLPERIFGNRVLVRPFPGGDCRVLHQLCGLLCRNFPRRHPVDSEGAVRGGLHARAEPQADLLPHHLAAGGQARGPRERERGDYAGEGYVAGAGDCRDGALRPRQEAAGGLREHLPAVRGGCILLCGEPFAERAFRLRGTQAQLL